MTDQPPFTVELSAGVPRKSDEPCPNCQRWTMWDVPVLIISQHGATEVGHIEQCEICDTEEDDDD